MSGEQKHKKALRRRARLKKRPKPIKDQKILPFQKKPSSLHAYSEASEIEIDSLEVEVPEGLEVGKPFVTLRAGAVCSRLTGETIASVDRELLSELVTVFQSRRGADPVIIDWNHNSSPFTDTSSTPETGGALGEIIDIRLSDDGEALIAIPAYTQRGREVVSIAEGSLWSSPEFITGGVHARESGEPTGSAQLLAITLTPRPQQSARVVDRVLLSEDIMTTREELEAMEREDLIDFTLQKIALVADLEGRSEDLAEDEEDEETTLTEDEDEEKEKNLSENSPPPVPVAMKETALLSEVNSLREAIVQLKEENSSVKRNSAVDALLRSGRISPAEKTLAEKAWNQADRGDDSFWSMFSERGEGSAVPLSETGHGVSGQESNKSTLVSLAQEIQKEKSVSFSEALDIVRTSNPDAYNNAYLSGV